MEAMSGPRPDSLVMQCDHDVMRDRDLRSEESGPQRFAYQPAGDMSQMVTCLPSSCFIPSEMPSLLFIYHFLSTKI